MGAKRSRIRRTIAAAQRRGKHLNAKQLASCEGKIRFSKEQTKSRILYSTQKFYKCGYGEHHHAGRKPGVHKRNGKYL